MQEENSIVNIKKCPYIIWVLCHVRQQFSISLTFIHLSHKKKVNIKTFVTDSQPGYDFRMFIKFWLILARLFWQISFTKKIKKSLVSLISYQCQSVQDNKSSNSNVLQCLTSSCQNVALFHWRKKFLGNVKMIANHVSLQCKKLFDNSFTDTLSFTVFSNPLTPKI